jgi:hypothetical protein
MIEKQHHTQDAIVIEGRLPNQYIESFREYQLRIDDQTLEKGRSGE